MPKIKAAGFIVYRDQSQREILLMRHANRWDFPKGHLDPGETKIQAAYRELLEETGITAEDIRMDGRFRFQITYTVNGKRYGHSGDLEKKLVLYLAELIRPVTLQTVEHQGYQWFSWSPPHSIQEKTIDPALDSLRQFWDKTSQTIDIL